MKRGGEHEDYMFLNLGPNHPSAHVAFRIILSLIHISEPTRPY